MENENRTTNWVKQKGVTFAQGLGHLLWPGQCINCREGAVESGELCDDCWQRLILVCGAEYCRRCGRDASPYATGEGFCANCRDEEIHFDGIGRAGVYAEALRETILAFKHGRTELDKVLGGLNDSALQASGFAGEVEIIVAVPLHWFKRLIRGYNQSLVLAKLLKHPTAKISTDLVRVRWTKAQPTMPTIAARAKNVEGAFAVRRGHPFAGRKICLIDDIKTTGATLNECARTLKEAGAAKVFALVLGVAGQSRD
jgi:competence protein ComFC